MPTLRSTHLATFGTNADSSVSLTNDLLAHIVSRDVRKYSRHLHVIEYPMSEAMLCSAVKIMGPSNGEV